MDKNNDQETPVHRYRYSFLLSAVAAAFSASATLAAPPAIQVLAEVHAASRLAVGRLDRVPAEGDVVRETSYVGTVTAQGLGEIMGWGQDRFDNVDPDTVLAIQIGFGQALREVEELPEGDADFGYDVLREATARIRGHLDGIRQAVDQAEDGGERTRRETRQAAGLLAHHAGEIVGSPLTPDNVLGKALVLRTLDVGFTTLKADLESFPDLAEPTNGAMSSLAVLRDIPPACSSEPEPTDECLSEMTGTMGAAFTSIEEAVAGSRQVD